MKLYKNYVFTIFLCLSAHIFADSSSVLPIPKADNLLVKVMGVSEIETRQKQLDKIKKEQERFSKIKLETEAELRANAEHIRPQIERLTFEIKKKPENEYLRKKQHILSELYQIYRDLLRDRERIVSLLDDTARVLHEYLNDPDYESFKKEYRLGERLFYSFEDLQRLYNLIQDQEKKVATLADESKHAVAELKARERASEATKETYKTKKEQVEKGKYLETEDLDAQQRSEILTLEERIYQYRKELDGLRIEEASFKKEYLGVQLFLAKSHLALFKDYVKAIKPAVRVTEADIVHAREDLTKKTQKHRITKEKYRSEIDLILLQEEQAQHKLQEAAKQYGITLGRDVADWARDSFGSASAYVAYCTVATLQTEFTTLQRKKDLLDAHIEFEDARLKFEQLMLQVKESYHRKFTTEDQIAQELKLYEGPRAESQAALDRAKEKINLIADDINNQKKILDNIVALQTKIKKEHASIFRAYPTEYTECLNFLAIAEASEKKQADLLSKLTGIYSGISLELNNKLRLISFISGELESRTIWYRPEYAITWDGIKNIVPDILNFLAFVRNYFVKGTFMSTFNRMVDVIKEPITILAYLIKLFLISFALLITYRILPHFINFLLSINDQGFRRLIRLLMVVFCEFSYSHFFSIAFWIIIFSSLLLQDATDTYLYIFFYLFSIPYLLYLSNRLVRFLAKFNEQYDFVFMAQDFQKRFWFALQVLLYSTITILFFREAFMQAYYYRSELPTILLAINFIILQIGLILLLGKEEILSFIPTRSEFWQLVREKVDRFYYLIILLIIAIIIMSNPYVGFGQLVLYGLFGSLYTIALFLVLYYLHGVFKRIASRIYFSSVEDVARERFTNAKTWFGLTIIVSFLLLAFVGFIIAAKIWGWPITYAEIKGVFFKPLIRINETNPVTIVTILGILGVIFVGFIIAYALNKFVLDRIYDLLLIDPGVQHTVSSLVQYVVILIFVFIAFQRADMGEFVTYAATALLLGLGWVLKDPISDIVAYFIILVQRPIKIGDFIVIDKEITGVVRKITARSVILRRKNSVTLIVPNTVVTSKTIINWNYTRNFIAFDDILLTVDYSENPEEVRKVLYEVVENHPNVLKNPKPWIRLDNFGEYGFEFMVRGFISSVYTLEKWEIASNIRIAIVKTFTEKGIRLALPTRLLLTRHNKNVDGINGVGHSHPKHDD